MYETAGSDETAGEFARLVPNSAAYALWLSSEREPMSMDVHALIGDWLRCCTPLRYRPCDPWSTRGAFDRGWRVDIVAMVRIVWVVPVA
jgi:hypothetical protein